MAMFLNTLLKKINKYLVFSSLLSGPLLTAAPLRFNELEAIVRNNNLHVKASREELTAASEREGHFIRSWLPEVYLEGGYENFKKEQLDAKTQPYAGARAELNIFRSGADQLESKIRSLEAKTSRLEHTSTFRFELLKAQVAYWSLAYYLEQRELLEKHLSRIKKQLDSANRRIRAGSSTPTDRIEFDMAIRLIEQDLSRNTIEIDNSKSLLYVLLDKDPNSPLTTLDPLPQKVAFQSKDSNPNIQALPEIQVARMQGEISNLKSKQSYREWLPSVDLYSELKHMNQRESDEPKASDRNEYAVGVKVSMKLFDGGKIFSESRSQSAHARAKEIESQQNARELAVDMKNSERELHQLSKLIQATSQDLNIVEDFLRRILAEYSRGVRSSSDVLSAAERTLEFQKRSAELRRDFQISKAKMAAITAEAL